MTAEQHKADIVSQNIMYPIEYIADQLGLTSQAILDMINKGAIYGELQKTTPGKGRKGYFVYIEDVLFAKESWYGRVKAIDPEEDQSYYEYLPVIEVAQKVDVSASRLRQLLREGRIDGYQTKEDRRWYTSLEKLRDYTDTIPYNLQRPIRGYNKREVNR